MMLVMGLLRLGALAKLLTQARQEVTTALLKLQDTDQGVGFAYESLASSHDPSRLPLEPFDRTTLAYLPGAPNHLEDVVPALPFRAPETAAATAAESARQSLIDLLAASGWFP